MHILRRGARITARKLSFPSVFKTFYQAVVGIAFVQITSLKLYLRECQCQCQCQCQCYERLPGLPRRSSREPKCYIGKSRGDRMPDADTDIPCILRYAISFITQDVSGSREYLSELTENKLIPESKIRSVFIVRHHLRNIGEFRKLPIICRDLCLLRTTWNIDLKQSNNGPGVHIYNCALDQ